MSDQASAEPGESVAEALGPLDEAFRPYAQFFAVRSAPPGTSPFVDPAWVSAVASVASVLYLLGQSTVESLRVRRHTSEGKTPDFQQILVRLRSGEIQPDEAKATLASWQPALTAIEVGLLIEGGDRDELRDLLNELGLPERLADRALKDAIERYRQLGSRR